MLFNNKLIHNARSGLFSISNSKQKRISGLYLMLDLDSTRKEVKLEE